MRGHNTGCWDGDLTRWEMSFNTRPFQYLDSSLSLNPNLPPPLGFCSPCDHSLVFFFTVLLFFFLIVKAEKNSSGQSRRERGVGGARQHSGRCPCRATQRVDLHNFILLSGKTEEEKTGKKGAQCGLFCTEGISKTLAGGKSYRDGVNGPPFHLPHTTGCWFS